MSELLTIDQSNIYAFVILPILIFFARVCDVSLGTIRIIFISKGIKYLTPVVGFIEILIWLLAISQIMQNLSNVYYYLFYAGGFATGNFVGICIDEKLSIGTVSIRIITRKDASNLVDALKKGKFGVTVIDAEGMKSKVKVIFTIVKRQNIEKVIKLMKKHNPNAFYSIEDIRFASETLQPVSSIWSKFGKINIFREWRKGK